MIRVRERFARAEGADKTLGQDSVECGALDGVSIEDKGKEIFDMILAVASGARTKSEQLGYGEAEFTPWQIGATM